MDMCRAQIIIFESNQNVCLAIVLLAVHVYHINRHFRSMIRFLAYLFLPIWKFTHM